MKKVNTLFGEGEPCFIIAEIGSNHNGSIATAKKMIDIAAESDADAAKFQIFQAENLYSEYTPEFSYLKGQNVYGLIKDIETPREWIEELARYCKGKIKFLATPFDFEAVDLLEKHVPAFKIASFEIVDLELIKYAAEKGKPMIISTGMANLGEVEDAVHAIRSVGNNDIVLLHCSSLYPAPVEAVNLKAMITMRRAFKVPVGFSDHTLGIHIPVAAVAMGACVIEKHFTLDRNLPGPDHSFAVEPHELKAMITHIRDIEKARGSGVKERSELESEEMYVKARRSIHAKVDIERGTTITKDMLTVKRPGFGVRPKFLDIVVGRKAKEDIKRDEWITWEKV
ncbi:MAG: N-acetylneuraminate synthase family protein [Theionarchaea archaeon]|nr:MAG: N-acetylneuraminate synthase [Theionarchaea archaeon DG-70-1]MBU7025613.1 N-acetylneuraminate synthase family protein [Theionarchaea archaeon]